MAKNINKLNPVNWEKIGIYVAVLAGFLTLMVYVIEMKVDIGKLQVEMQHVQKRDKE